MKCPLLNSDCIKEECSWFVKIMNKNTDGTLKESYSCAIPLLVDINIEGVRKTMGVQAAVESHRNESVKRQDVLLRGLSQRKVVE